MAVVLHTEIIQLLTLILFVLELLTQAVAVAHTHLVVAELLFMVAQVVQE